MEHDLTATPRTIPQLIESICRVSDNKGLDATARIRDIDEALKQLQEMRSQLTRQLHPEKVTDPALLSPTITAEVHDDHHRNSATFNAAGWFAQASDEKIKALHGIDWGGNFEADEVAEFFDGKDDDVSAVFQFTRMVSDERNPIGFECHVEEDEAMDWLKVHRNTLWNQLSSQDN